MIVQDKKSNKTKKFGTAIILAGGKSTRMGFDKQFLVIDKIIEKHLLEFEKIVLVTNKPEYYASYKNDFLMIVSDEIKDNGPLAGIQVGLKNSNSEYSYVTACDMPIISLEYIKFLKTKISENGFSCDACLVKHNNFEPMNAFYSKNVLQFLTNLNNTSISSIINQLNCLFVSEAEFALVKNKNIFTNLNTQEDLKKFECDMSKKNND